MTLRIDRVLTEPGLVAGAKTWTLLTDGGALYVLPLGPGRAQTMPRADPISMWLAKKMMRRMFRMFDRKVLAAEERLAVQGPGPFADAGKGERFAPSKVSVVAAEGNRLRLELGGKPRVFYGTGLFQDHDRSDELAAFASGLRAWAAS